MNTSNQQCSNSSRKTRKLPNFKNEEDNTLETLAARSVFQQYLAKFPDQLGPILAMCPPKARSDAIKSLSLRDVSCVKIPIEDIMKGPPLGLFDEIRVVVTSNEDPTDARLDIIRAAAMDERLKGVLSLWLEDFYKTYPDADSRNGNIERDGSAILSLDSSMAALQDFIERYVADGIAENQNDEDNDGLSDDSGFLAFDDEVEHIEEEFRNVFSSISSMGEIDVSSKKIGLFRPVSKITVRYVDSA